MFFLPYRQTDDSVVDNFPKIPDHFPKISDDSPKLVRTSHERCRTFSENVGISARITKDFEEAPKMSPSYTNEFKYNLKDKLDISEIIDIYGKY